MFVVGMVRDGLLIAARWNTMGCFPFDLVLVLLLVALSSSSDEMSTTFFADISGSFSKIVNLAFHKRLSIRKEDRE